MGLVKLRIGSISGGTDGSISQTTLGAGFNVGLGLNVAWITDNKNSKNNSMVFDFGFAL